MTERLHFDFSLSCIGEGNGNPLQCSCLENPRDGGAWWAAISGAAQSRTRLKRLSSSSSSSCLKCRHFPRIQYIACFSCVELLLIWQPEHLGKLSTLVLNGDCILFCNISCKQRVLRGFFCWEMPVHFFFWLSSSLVPQAKYKEGDNGIRKEIMGWGPTGFFFFLAGGTSLLGSWMDDGWMDEWMDGKA